MLLPFFLISNLSPCLLPHLSHLLLCRTTRFLTPASILCRTNWFSHFSHLYCVVLNRFLISPLRLPVYVILQAINTRIGDDVVRGVSGGERKRVSIGIELLAEPAVIILDEPTSGLDSASAALLIESLRAIASNEQRTVRCKSQRDAKSKTIGRDWIQDGLRLTDAESDCCSPCQIGCQKPNRFLAPFFFFFVSFSSFHFRFLVNFSRHTSILRLLTSLHPSSSFLDFPLHTHTFSLCVSLSSSLAISLSPSLSLCVPLSFSLTPTLSQGAHDHPPAIVTDVCRV